MNLLITNLKYIFKNSYKLHKTHDFYPTAATAKSKERVKASPFMLICSIIAPKLLNRFLINEVIIYL